MTDATAVGAVNALTGRWARAAVSGAESTVLTGAGAWPLLALLAGAAGGPARGELEDALGVGAGGAAGATALGREAVEAMAAMDGVAAATGLWTRHDLPVRPEWEAELPRGVRGVLSGDTERDGKELDAWASRCTDGAIDRMPVPLTPVTQLVLAGALTVRTAWQQPFQPGFLRPGHGPWRDRSLAGLTRKTGDLDGVLRVVPDTPAGPLTLSGVAGGNGIDVHLVLGAEDVPGGRVLEAGIGAVAGEYSGRGGSALAWGEAGPGVTVMEAVSWDATPSLVLTTPQFTVTARHDLLRHAELFGLRTAQDTSRGHFPGISPSPLALSSGQQSMTASFSAEGFWAAAVTAFAMAPGSAPPQRKARLVKVVYDRPFGFLAVHRATGLVLTAGWVTEPEAAQGVFRK
ncbi:serpin family protein [Streptomyces sp. NBRC 110028]|uniref:serpin family protein n=1 Tax=Streptomyces sp. NBRC 110028 TaxID=1621260 RepID=UPI0006E298DE|nr:serpin family protein [Streptomyces sp. NBRC 110028]